MAKISIKNLAQAIYESTKGKEGLALDSIIEKSGRFVRDRNLLGKKEEILNAVEDIINKENGIVKAKVGAGGKLKSGISKEIEESIKKRYKAKEVHMEITEDKNFIGGIKIEVGDEVLDATLLNKVHQLQNYLTAN